MPAPLVVAAAKVGGKVAMKKIAAKQVAKKASQTVAKKYAQKTAEKIGSQAIKSKTQNISIKRPTGNLVQKLQQGKNLSTVTGQAQGVKDDTKQDEPKNQNIKAPQKLNFLDRIFSKGQTNLSTDPNDTTPRRFDYHKTFSEKEQLATNEHAQTVPKQSKAWYNTAMFLSIWKDAVEIGINLLALGWLGPVLSFAPTIGLTFVLFASGKKSTIKIISYFLAIVIDLLIPGVNTLPITTIATFIVFHIKPDSLKQLDKNNTNKGIEIIKKFIKLK